MTSPLEIKIALHYHVSPSQFGRTHAPAITEAHDKFVKLGLLKLEDGKYSATPALHEFVKSFTDIELPKPPRPMLYEIVLTNKGFAVECVSHAHALALAAALANKKQNFKYITHGRDKPVVIPEDSHKGMSAAATFIEHANTIGL